LFAMYHSSISGLPCAISAPYQSAISSRTYVGGIQSARNLPSSSGWHQYSGWSGLRSLMMSPYSTMLVTAACYHPAGVSAVPPATIAGGFAVGAAAVMPRCYTIRKPLFLSQRRLVCEPTALVFACPRGASGACRYSTTAPPPARPRVACSG